MVMVIRLLYCFVYSCVCFFIPIILTRSTLTPIQVPIILNNYQHFSNKYHLYLAINLANYNCKLCIMRCFTQGILISDKHKLSTCSYVRGYIYSLPCGF